MANWIERNIVEPTCKNLRAQLTAGSVAIVGVQMDNLVNMTTCEPLRLAVAVNIAKSAISKSINGEEATTKTS